MRKEVFYDKNALKELQELGGAAQKEFQAYIAILVEEGKLEFPEARKVSKNLFSSPFLRPVARKSKTARINP